MKTISIANSRKPFPSFIKNNPNIKNLSEKIFPLLGLNNCIQPASIKIDCSDLDLKKVVHLAIQRYLSLFNDEHCISDFKGSELLLVAEIIFTLKELSRRISKNEGIKYNKSLILTDSILSFDKKVLVKSGTDIFKLVNKLLKIGEKYAQVDLFDKANFQKECKNLNIVFSSDGLNGAWDIATMSMRGIKSCMRWTASQAYGLVGSITDPSCGIIYLTNGSKTKYGSKMLFRAVVRFIVDANDKPAILLDRLYSAFYKHKPGEHNKIDLQIRDYFIKFLKSKIPSNVRIVDVIKDNGMLHKYYMPLPPNFSKLAEIEQSYRDTKDVIYSQNTYNFYRDLFNYSENKILN